MLFSSAANAQEVSLMPHQVEPSSINAKLTISGAALMKVMFEAVSTWLPDDLFRMLQNC